LKYLNVFNCHYAKLWLGLETVKFL